MNRRDVILSGVAAIGLSLIPASGAAALDQARLEIHDEWASHFAEAGVEGTIVIYDAREQAKYHIYNDERAEQRFIPASTFKVPHALFALDAGVVEDEFQIFKWDGVKRPISAWNRDQNLRSSMRHSAVWLYQQWAREIGEEQRRAYLRQIDYGNANPGGGVDRFWLDGDLRISAMEQIGFLQKLYRNNLPFAEAHQRLVKDVMVNEAGGDWILRAKTGWSIRTNPNIGWWVGWVERPNGPVFFALNIDMPKGSEDALKRISIAKNILHELGALPKSSIK
jgi:beta-lactamase class D